MRAYFYHLRRFPPVNKRLFAAILRWNMSSITYHVIIKSAAKLILIFDICKFFCKKNEKKISFIVYIYQLQFVLNYPCPDDDSCVARQYIHTYIHTIVYKELHSIQTHIFKFRRKGTTFFLKYANFWRIFNRSTRNE